MDLYNIFNQTYRKICKSDFGIELALIDIDKLIPHEKIEPMRIKKLSASIEKSKHIKHPIPCIEVDNYYLVLDGHHRLETLKALGLKYAPIQIVNKNNFVLDYWYHDIKKAHGIQEIYLILMTKKNMVIWERIRLKIRRLWI